MGKSYRDILLADDGDLLIEDGGFVIGESIDQEVETILKLNQGQLRNDPLLGPGLITKIKSNFSPTQIKKLIKLHIERDAKKVRRLEHKRGETKIDAEQR